MALKPAFRLAFDENMWPIASRAEGILPFLEALLPTKCADKSAPLVTAARTIAQSLEIHGQALAAQGRENTYHNREHIMDVLLGLHCLIDQPVHGLDHTQQLILIVTMLAHDYGHNGSINRFQFDLERKSFAAVRPYLEDAGVSKRHQARIRRLILLTDPSCQQWVQHLGPSVFATQAKLIVEADLMASLMPARGFYLGARLAEEQMRQGLSQAQIFATLEGRYRFLSAVRFCSAAAMELGLEDIRSAQLDCITRYFKDQMGEGWSAALGRLYAKRVHEIMAANMC